MSESRWPTVLLRVDAKTRTLDAELLPDMGFDAFTNLVIGQLRARAQVQARTEAILTSLLRDIRFTADTPLDIHEWTEAIATALGATRLISDRSMWSFRPAERD